MRKCQHPPAPDRIFCPVCGKVQNREDLLSIRLAGFVGVIHSTSPKIEEFWQTGDPDVFTSPKV